MKQNDDNIPNIITACCVLHNICQIHGDVFNEDGLQDVNEDGSNANGGSHGSGSDVRNTLIEYFTQKSLLLIVIPMQKVLNFTIDK